MLAWNDNLQPWDRPPFTPASSYAGGDGSEDERCDTGRRGTGTHTPPCQGRRPRKRLGPGARPARRQAHRRPTGARSQPVGGACAAARRRSRGVFRAGGGSGAGSGASPRTGVGSATLLQQQPVIARVLYQQPARLDQALLQAGQWPALDALWAGPAAATDSPSCTRARSTALLHESSLARTMPIDKILTGRCDTTLVGRGRSSD